MKTVLNSKILHRNPLFTFKIYERWRGRYERTNFVFCFVIKLTIQSVVYILYTTPTHWNKVSLLLDNLIYSRLLTTFHHWRKLPCGLTLPSSQEKREEKRSASLKCWNGYSCIIKCVETQTFQWDGLFCNGNLNTSNTQFPTLGLALGILVLTIPMFFQN